MNACLKHPKTWFIVGGIVLVSLGVAAVVHSFCSDTSCASSGRLSLTFSSASAALDSAEPGSAGQAKDDAAGKKEARRGLTKEDRANGLRLLEEARVMELGRDGRAPDLQKAFALYKKAAALGSAEAWYRMGMLAQSGKLDGVSPGSAMGFLRNAADRGYKDAYVALARAFMEGKITKADEVRAEFYLEKAIAASSGEAMFLKGARLIESPGQSGEGLALLLEAAKDGSADAQHTVARMFRDGTGVEQNAGLAEEWLRLAIENGSPRAKYDLAELMMKNARTAGVQLSTAQTSELVGLLTGAAAEGSGSAAKALGLVMLKGGFSPENLRAVRDYAEQSFDAGRADAAFLMAMTYALEKGADTDTALQWLELGAVGNDWKSRYARQLVREGADVTWALKTTVGATYQDWVEKYDESVGTATPSGVVPPKIISMTPPKFPSGFASLDVKGSALVEFVVAQDGIPQAVQVIRSTHPEFADAAVKAVQTWKLEPAQKDGKYTPLKVRFPVNFKNSL
jgi:TonB family protein